MGLMKDREHQPANGIEFERGEHSGVDLRLKLQCRVERPCQPDPTAWKSIENIGRGGMLIRWGSGTESTPAVGDVILLKLKLPMHPVFGQRWMFFNGSVVRVTHDDDATSLLVAVAGAPVKFSRVAQSALSVNRAAFSELRHPDRCLPF